MSSGREDVASEGVSKTDVHASRHWEHMCKSSLNVAEKTDSLTVTTEKKGEQVFVDLSPVNCDPVFILKHS